jgi:hypothetical protein
VRHHFASGPPVIPKSTAPSIVPAAEREVMATSAIDRRAKLPLVRDFLTKIPAGFPGGFLEASVDGDLDASKLEEGDVFRLRLAGTKGSFGSTKIKRFGAGSYAECHVRSIKDNGSGPTAIYVVDMLVEPIDADHERAYPVRGIVLNANDEPEDIYRPEEAAMHASEIGARLGQLAFGDADHFFKGDALAWAMSHMWSAFIRKPAEGEMQGVVNDGTPVRIQLVEDVWF